MTACGSERWPIRPETVGRVAEGRSNSKRGALLAAAGISRQSRISKMAIFPLISVGLAVIRSRGAGFDSRWG